MALMDDAVLPRLLAGFGEQPMSQLAAHVDVHGPLPDLDTIAPEALLDEVEESGLRGHGGASFPMAKKMRSVAARRKPKVVLANGSEGEPASRKDRVLMRELPHLLLDGAAVAAHAVGAHQAIIAVCTADVRSLEALELAIDQRRRAGYRDPAFELCEVPERYLSGQESALVNLINGGGVLPTFGTRPFQRGVGGRPTLVQNVETLAHLALIARHGAEWFRGLGTARDPGSALVTLSGAVARPGVYEIAHGTPLAELLQSAEVAEPLRGVLIGGYFGSWLPAGQLPALRLSAEQLRDHGATLGAGIIVALGSSACPVAECSRVADFFSAESAGQCGPCVHGLAAVADTVAAIASGTADRMAWHDLERWLAELPGRGACQHPDGATRFVTSALRVFGEDFRQHAAHGRCELCDAAPVLPVPATAPVAGRAALSMA